MALIVQIEAKIEFDESEDLGIENSIWSIPFPFQLIYLFLDFEHILRELKTNMEVAVSDSNVYDRVKNGFQVLIFGPPNVGKSSLMNYFGKFVLLCIS